MAELQTGQDKNYVGVASAAGSVTISIKAERNIPWLIRQVSNRCETQADSPTASLSKNGYPITPLVPQFDAAGGDPPVPLRPSDTMTVDFAGLDPGDVVQVYVLYDEMGWSS